jgi:hypothetical protein
LDRTLFVRRAVATLGTIATLAAPLVSVTPAHAAPASPKYFDRKMVIARAKTWTARKIPYSQTNWYDGYRTDCSGFISMAWQLQESYVTWSLPEIARPITKEELQPGDIILNTTSHVVMFGGWLDKAHKTYLVYEQAGTPHKAVARPMVYPYYADPAGTRYKPYRYVGGDNLKAPGTKIDYPLVQTYAGRGQVLVPQAGVKINAATNARAAKLVATAKAKKAAETRAKAQAVAAAKLKALAAGRAKARAATVAAAPAKATAGAGVRLQAQAVARLAAAQRGTVEKPQPVRQAALQEPVVLTMLRSMVAFITR